MIRKDDPATSENLTEHVAVESMNALELRGVLEEVAHYAVSDPGRIHVLDTEPETQPGKVRKDLDLVSELRELVGLHGALSLGGLIPLEGVFARLEHPATILEAEEILGVRDFLFTVQLVQNRLTGIEPRFEQLVEIGRQLIPLEDLGNRIAGVLDEHGLVRSSASPELQRLRERSRSARSRINRVLEGIVHDRDLSRIVQEDFVTLRGDRYVILLRPEFKGLLEGIVHDHSRSGASVYVEPLEVVEFNNEVASLIDQERDEIRRIFSKLTESIRSSLEQIAWDYSMVAFLDAFQARALYAIQTKATVPELVEGGFRILGARHPLLLAAGEEPVVPMDVIQETSTLATVISGANMGGKTVALKIAGLFPLMARCAIMLPASEGTRINPFSHIMADIGDEQNIRSQVSTFSGHMLRIKFILAVSGEGDLVLLDELGSATDPVEGAALAMGILDELVGRGTRVVLTTHLTHLKAYALGRPDVKNVSVEFHPKTLRPTYKLLYDLPGESHAIATAEMIGLPDKVVAAARGYLATGEGGGSSLIERLRERISETERLQEALEEREKELQEELAKTKAQREEVVQEFRKKALELVKEAEREISSLQRSVKQRKVSKRAPREQLRDLRHRLSEGLGTPLEIEPRMPEQGSRVRVETLGKEGVVRSILDKGQVEVSVGKVKIRADADDLTLIEGPLGKKNASNQERIRVDIPLVNARREVNVIGQRADDAIPLVERAIDEAVLAGLTSLSIIHGKGTGRLKQAIWDHFSSHALVKGLHEADIHLGGAGVTLADLKTE
jgi:DNA mismatch repair protein MutS2